MTALDPLRLYRLPWSLTDNPIAWLEPTQQCNLACDGCYRENVKQHKSLEEVTSELETFAKLRNFDGVSIAGGDPLLHPNIVDIVRRVQAMGRKAILNTNGLALTPELLKELKAAGLVGLTFHVDCHQGRPGWRDKTEAQMNALRQEYVDLVSSVGGVAIAFNSTVYDDTLEQVPDVVEWAGRNIDRVHTVVFIVYRAAHKEGFDYFANGQKIDVSKLVYSIDAPRKTDLDAHDVVRTIRKRVPDFEPCAYLGGTVDPSSFKWLIGMRIGSRSKVHGWVGPRFMEMTQTGHHFFTKRYMAYAPPPMLAAGRSSMLSAWAVDAGVRGASKSWLKTVAKSPLHALEKQHFQAVVCIQPIDVMADGRDNMCDGCPDMTVHEGKLVWSCRLEEWRQFGTTMTAAPRGCGASRTTQKDGLISIRTPSSAAE
jgi:MoaA/NifB/PqqE/SkfB family radical SAM enzyme